MLLVVQLPGQLLAAPSGYGEYFLRAEDVPAYRATQLEPAPPEELARYQTLLQDAELAGGPYADALAEPLAQLGDQQFAAGDYRGAVATYRRALHVLRVNDGLYSERQMPVLRQLILAFRETRDWETLDERYEYFFRIYGQGQAPYTELRLRAALEYLRWQREALQLKLGSESRRLLDLIALNGDLVKAVMNDPAAPYDWKKELAASQMANLYLAIDVFEPYVKQAEFSNSKDIFGAKPLSVDLDQQRMNNMLRTAPAKGRQLMLDLKAAAAGGDVVEIASLDLALGDWHHWNGNRSRASQAYSAVEQRLLAAGENDVLAEWLGEPVELPANGAFVRPPAQGEAARIRARFDVSSKGRVSDIDTTQVAGEATGSSRFRRRLAATLFRPRWEDGRPVGSDGVEREYQLLP